MSANAIRRTILVFLTIVTCGLMSFSVAAQTSQRVAGTTVTMTPPKGFESAKDFSGFADQTTKSSIVITELPPQAWPQLSAIFAKLDTVRTAFKQKDIEVAALDRVPTASGEAYLASGTQTIAGTKLAKWVALVQGSRTIMITVQAFPAANLDDTAIKAMMKTVALGDAPSVVDKLSSLPFAVAPAAPFRILDTMIGSTVLMTVGDKDVDPERAQPILIVAAQIGGAQVGNNAAATAKALLHQTQDMGSVTIDTEKTVTFGGARDGVLLEGKALGDKRFVQYFGTGPNGRFVRLVSIFAANRNDELRPAIEQIAGSVAFK